MESWSSHWARGYDPHMREEFKSSHSILATDYSFVFTKSYYICESTGENRFQQSKRRNIHVCLPQQTVPVEVKFVGETDEWEIVQRTQIRLDSRNPISQPMTFGAYVETLDAWEIDLLRHTQCFADPMMISLELCFQFMAGSDGSERYDTHGAFGWMVSNLSGERIASGMGPSRGYRMDSYRAESSGMLSFLRFLIRTAEFTQQTASDWHGTVGTDSQSLLDRLFGKKAKTAEECYGSDILDVNVLTPEMDLLIEIKYALQRLPGVSLKFVKDIKIAGAGTKLFHFSRN